MSGLKQDDSLQFTPLLTALYKSHTQKNKKQKRLPLSTHPKWQELMWSGMWSLVAFPSDSRSNHGKWAGLGSSQLCLPQCFRTQLTSELTNKVINQKHANVNERAGLLALEGRGLSTELVALLKETCSVLVLECGAHLLLEQRPSYSCYLIPCEGLTGPQRNEFECL